MTEYNEGKQKIDMVLFNMALEHLTRINRVLKMDTGHILLIGVAGSGKTLMTKLAAFTAGINFVGNRFNNVFSTRMVSVRFFRQSGCQMFSIIVSKGYGETSFKEDLKKLFLMVGVDNKPAVFFLTQSQVSDESIYVDTFKMFIYNNNNSERTRV